RVRGEGYKMVNMGELFANARIGDIPMERVPMNEREIENFSLEEGDLLFARQSLVLEGAGQCSYIAAVPETTTFESHLIRVRLDREKAHPLYYHYLFASPYSGMSTIVQQCAQAGIRASDLVELSVFHPPVDTQQKIASILSTYDDLIENNRRRMTLLEDAARQVYQEWFVRLRFPGYEHTRIVDGVPEGWEKKRLGDVCYDVREAVLPEALEPDTPYIGLEHIPRRSISLIEWGNAQQVTSTKLRFREGEILFGKIRPYFHKVGIAFVDGVASSDTIIIRPNEEKLHGLVLMTASSDPFVANTSQTMKEGSKMPRADWKQMQEYPVAVPPDGLLYTFNDTISSITSQLKNLTFQNQKLRTARDLLLPKLMSGEIAV
ncbi:MAG: restriction endonuclease subunit S, partial [Geobacter sp.]